MTAETGSLLWAVQEPTPEMPRPFRVIVFRGKALAEAYARETRGTLLTLRVQ